ncbi:hypothetical protein [Mycobacterium intracellulare]|uniref:hypothetical protein n=1 Tax=Mycobacterium intracellulare TaxID=1767 RepID=UPI0019168A60|nr:hypothetical protein [Mycobacterium intracellulare]MCA2355762.1 hypothetical protein [Mycobacterium intracellulare]MCA2365990.1 hypothetical protein [Mycobacterium intracellulare]
MSRTDKTKFCYHVEVTLDGRWWMITVPELDGYKDADGAVNLSDTTQARRLSEVPIQALDFIAVCADTPIDDIEMRISWP